MRIATVPYNPSPAQLLPVSSAISGSSATIQWRPGTGATQYWLALGTTVGGNDLYNERNLGTTTLSATVTSIPPNVSNVYATLYSKINNVWQPSQTTISVIQPTSSQIPASFRTCIATAGASPTNRRECVLPYGIYYMSYADGTRNAGLTFVNDTIDITASNLTVRGGLSASGQKPRIIRYEAAVQNIEGPQNPCDPMIRFAQGISFITLKDFDIDGGALSKAGNCLSSDPNQPQPQPQVNDIEVATNYYPAAGNFLRDIDLDSLRLSNAIGRALLIWGPDIENVRVLNSEFIEANLTGILIGRDGVWPPNQEGHLSCDPGNAAATANVPRYITIQNNTFFRSWTGATSQNDARSVVYRSNSFVDNYYQPYDQGGGTVNDEVCVYNTQFLGRNYFDARGVDKDTSALELHGINTAVQAEGSERTEIRNYWHYGIIARSIRNLTIRGAIVEDNVRVPGVDWGGIQIWNVPSRRLSSDISILDSTIRNSVGNSQAFAVRFKDRDPSTNQPPDQIFNITIQNNVLAPNRIRPLCQGSDGPFGTLSPPTLVGVSVQSPLGVCR